MITVVGDFMVDEYVEVAIERISPEAPVPIMRELRRDFKPGGAGNVAANIKSMGGMVRLMSVLGEIDSRWWNRIVEQCPWALWINDATRPTTTKTRFVADRGQQVARLDLETDFGIGPIITAKLKDAIEVSLKDTNVLVISDYQKGVVTTELARWLVDGAIDLKIPIIVDSKNPNISCFDGATIWTPNEKEYADAIVTPRIHTTIITKGARGMKLVRDDHPSVEIKAYEPHAVADVTGAGDTVVAALAVWIAQHGIGDLEDAAQFANRAASVAVSKRGTAQVSAYEIK